jgi:glucose-6-phosphate isomerase
MDTAKLSIRIDGLIPAVALQEVTALYPAARAAQQTLLSKTGKGNDFLGWVDLPGVTPDVLLEDLGNTARRLAAMSDVCVVTGIGGSYLGARAVIEALQHAFNQMLPARTPAIAYAGHQLSSDYMADLMDLLEVSNYTLIIISKSGTTTEPALAFRMLKAHLEKKYGKEEAKQRIVAVTDKSRGVLKTLADREGYETYVVPDDVGGRFSVFTPVGLLPIAVAGFNITELLAGARFMQKMLTDEKEPESNPALLYACARNAAYQKGFLNEVLVNYEPRLIYVTEWWKQLFGESEGKEHKGIFPAGVNFTTDLHSMGQYLQDGRRHLFETVISVKNSVRELVVPEDPDKADGLDFLTGKRFSEINHKAEEGTFMAHRDGGVPIIRIALEKIDEYSLGQLLYFFEFSCAISGYMLDVNPFDQPGVEAYKKNMFELLGKK